MELRDEGAQPTHPRSWSEKETCRGLRGDWYKRGRDSVSPHRMHYVLSFVVMRVPTVGSMQLAVGQTRSEDSKSVNLINKSRSRWHAPYGGCLTLRGGLPERGLVPIKGECMYPTEWKP